MSAKDALGGQFSIGTFPNEGNVDPNYLDNSYDKKILFGPFLKLLGKFTYDDSHGADGDSSGSGSDGGSS